ncbi:MAG: DUF4469 domain-containing protein [Spirochaetaceae bacterium]|jgi:hypothetical protein|nr:DUF4469 domain-containing protein [Spirochaetaceae bacterium]
MAFLSNLYKLHNVIVRLYPNYFTNVEGAYIARTNSEASLTIEQICAALKERGGFTGNYDDLVEHVKQFLDEMAYQLCDGFAVNTGYFSIHPNVGGTFDKITEGYDVKKHPITFRFRTRAPLRTLAEHITVEVEGLADVQGYIDEFVDVSTEAVNETLTPNGLFSISGHKIKMVGDDPDVGVYFVSEADQTQKVKVAGNLAENTASKLIGVIPGLAAGTWKVEVKTQFSGSGSTMLKKSRTIGSAFTLTVAAPAP